MELKIPPLLLVLLAGLVMWLAAWLLPAWSLAIPGARVIAVVLVVAGLGLIASGVIAFRRRNTTVDPRSPEQSCRLVTDGIYRYTRNPMYLGFLLMLSAWAVLLGNLLAFAVLPAFVMYMNRFQITPEERALTDLFGDEYVRYTEAVRRWL